MLEALLTTEELARVLHKTPEAVLQDRYRGASLPPAIKIGSRLFWKPEDVTAWIEAHREKAAVENSEAPAFGADASQQIVSDIQIGTRNG